jgi:hypothetical protein
MALGLAFWIIMLLWFIFAMAWNFGWIDSHGPIGNAIMLFLLFLLLGWKVFGAPLHG